MMPGGSDLSTRVDEVLRQLDGLFRRLPVSTLLAASLLIPASRYSDLYIAPFPVLTMSRERERPRARSVARAPRSGRTAGELSRAYQRPGWGHRGVVGTARSGPLRGPPSSTERVQALHDLALGHEADDLVAQGAVLEEHELRDRLHAEARREHRMLVHVDLADRHRVAQLPRDLVQHRRDRPARTAPRRPEVDDHRALAGHHAVEVRVRHLHEGFHRNDLLTP